MSWEEWENKSGEVDGDKRDKPDESAHVGV